MTIFSLMQLRFKIITFAELRCIMFERLLTTPWEESERSRFMKIISERDKKNDGVIAKLQAQLNEEIEVIGGTYSLLGWKLDCFLGSVEKA